MILDNRAILSDKQLVTVDAASTSYYDLGVPGKSYPFGIQLKRNMFQIPEVPFLVEVNTAFASGDGMTSLEIIIQSDEDPAFGSPTAVASVTLPIASLVKGFKLPMKYLPAIKERYFRVYYNVIGGTANAGAITAAVVGAVDAAYQG